MNSKLLIVDGLSRLTRDAVECERVIRRLEFSGPRIVATSDGYDSSSKARKVHRGFKGLMNEIFLDDLPVIRFVAMFVYDRQ